MRRRPDLTRWILAFAVVLLVVSLVAPTASAQEAGEPAPPDADDGPKFQQVEKLEAPDVLDSGNTSDLWVWPEGRLGYLAERQQVTPFGTQALVSYDLDTLERRARSDLQLLDEYLAGGLHNALAIDREAGVLYVAHHNTTGELDAENDLACRHKRNVVFAGGRPCFGGVYVLDATTLEPTGVEYIKFAPIGTDGAGVGLALGGLSYTPKYGGKLHVLLVEDSVSKTDLANIGYEPHTHGRIGQQYAAQIDVDSGDVDWMVSLSGCTGQPGSEGVFGAAVIFASPDSGRPHVWVGCWAGGSKKAGIVRLDLDETDPEKPVVEGQQRFLAPTSAERFAAEPGRERILVKTLRGGAGLWWVFDGRLGGFVSRVGIGPFTNAETMDHLDPFSGRLYTFAPSKDGETTGDRHPGGLGFTDTRRSELAQYQWDPSLLEHYIAGETSSSGRIAVDPAGRDRPRRVFLRGWEGNELAPHFLVFEDTVPITTDQTEEAGSTTRTDDVPEVAGVTDSRFQGSARGYGFRNILVNGLKGTAATGIFEEFENLIMKGTACNARNRTVAFGLAGSPEADRLAAIDSLDRGSATARAAHVDEVFQEDLDDPYSRCRLRASDSPAIQRGYDSMYERLDGLIDDLPIRGLPEEPGVEEIPGAAPAACALPDPDPEKGQVGDPVFKGFSAEVTCEVGSITGAARARTVAVGPVSVAGAGSSYRVEHRDGGGIVAHVDSWTRGVSITGDAGSVTIDGIRTTVTAWANGRVQPEDVADDPNCDTARTAGSCLRRHFSGVTVVDDTGETVYTCEQCSDEDNQRQLVAGMQRALGTDWQVNLPPADDSAAGAADGAEVAVLKRDDLRFADSTLKNDLLPTLPGLEIVRVNDTEKEMGRQVFQFAGVEADLTYGITCLLTVVDGECRGEPTSLEISLTDVDGDPLEGALFRVQPDPDGDGQISLDESLLDAYACTTGPDGTCTITGMRPGTYVVTQATAPPGYVPAPDKAIDLPEGGQGRLDIVNGTPSVTGIAISLHDTSSPPRPLKGAQFEVHTGTAPVEAPLATCTTNANGTCEFEVAAVGGIDPITDLTGQDLTHVLQVPAGPYVLHQSSAPDGYQPVDDIAFDLPDGQIARVDLTNGVVAAGDEVEAAPPPSTSAPSGGAVAAEPSPEPVSFQQPPEVPAPQFTINVNVQQEAPAPAPQVAGDEGHTFNVFQNPIGSAKLLLRDPKEAAAFAAAWLLFGSAAAAAWRRRMILAQFDV